MLQHLTKKNLFLNHIFAHYVYLLYSTAFLLALSLKFNIHILCIIWLTHCPHNPTQPNISQKDQKKTKIVQWFGVMWSKRQHAVKNESPKPKENLNVWASYRSFPHRRVLYWQLQGTSFSFASPHTSPNQCGSVCRIPALVGGTTCSSRPRR